MSLMHYFFFFFFGINLMDIKIHQIGLNHNPKPQSTKNETRHFWRLRITQEDEP